MSERVLVISPEVVFPTNAGGRAAVLAQCEAVRQAGFAVDLLAFHREPVSSRAAQQHADLADHMQLVPRRSLLAATFTSPAAPYQISGRRLSRASVAQIRRMPRPDIVIAQQEWTVAAAAQVFADDPVPIVLSSHNDEAAYYGDQLRAATGARRAYLLLEYLRIGRALRRLRQHVSAVVTLTREDEKAYTGLAVRTIPHPLPIAPAADGALPEPGTVLFVGALDMPHAVQGLRWFTEQVWPDIRAALPGSTFEVVGRRAPSQLRHELARVDGLTFLGEVDDLAPVYARAACFVNPVFLGSGVNIKLAEPIGRAIPCVTTSVGARGYDALGDALVVTDRPEPFAAACIGLIQNRAHAQRVSGLLQLRGEGLRAPGVAAQWGEALHAVLRSA